MEGGACGTMGKCVYLVVHHIEDCKCDRQAEALGQVHTESEQWVRARAVTCTVVAPAKPRTATYGSQGKLTCPTSLHVPTDTTPVLASIAKTRRGRGAANESTSQGWRPAHYALNYTTLREQQSQQLRFFAWYEASMMLSCIEKAIFEL